MLTRTIDVNKRLPDLKGLLSLVADGTEVVLAEGNTPICTPGANYKPSGWFTCRGDLDERGFR